MFWNRKKKNKPVPPLEGKEIIKFIENAGGCICTRSIWNGETTLRWCVREKPVNPADNGWRFIGATDDEDYINVVENNMVLDFNTVANIEPAILGIYDMPIGTDLAIHKEKDGKIRFLDLKAGKEIIPDR